MRILNCLLALSIGLTSYAGAKIEWSHTRHDFGAFDESMGKAEAVFTLYNRGDEPLVISGARANCGCTRPTLSADVIAPGDSARLTVAYDPEGRPGRFDKKIYIDSNGEPRRSTLTITGVSVGSPSSVSAKYPVEVGPMRLAHPAALLGSVTRGKMKSGMEGGYNASPTDTLRPVIVSSPKWLDVKPVNEFTPPGVQMAFHFFVNSFRIPEWDVVTDTVAIAPYAGSPDVYRMPVIVTVNEDFSTLSGKELAASPAMSVAPQKTGPVEITADGAHTVFTIANTGQSPLKIRRIYTRTPGVSFDAKRDLTIKPGKEQAVRVTLSPECLQGSAAASIVVTVIANDPLKPKTTVTVPVLKAGK